MFLKNTTNLEHIKNLLQLYDYCPYCQNNLIFRLNKRLPIITIEKNDDYFHDSICYGDARRSIVDHFDYPTTKIKFLLDSLHVLINLDTKELTEELVTDYDANVPHQAFYSGITSRYFGNIKECISCRKFSYNIQHVVRTHDQEIEVVSCLKEINIIYNEQIISYCYDRQKTELHIFEQENFDVNEGVQHILEVPLLELNIKNPQAVVERIKKLHLFT